jgi:hypothetical protein
MDYTDSEQGQYDLLEAQHLDEEIQKFQELKYEVYHPDGECNPPRFATWGEAIAKQVEWNRDCPGHIARKVRRAKSTQKHNTAC